MGKFDSEKLKILRTIEKFRDRSYGVDGTHALTCWGGLDQNASNEYSHCGPYSHIVSHALQLE